MENKIINKVNKLIEDKEWVHKTKSTELLLLKSSNEKETLIEHYYEIGGIKLTSLKKYLLDGIPINLKVK